MSSKISVAETFSIGTSMPLAPVLRTIAALSSAGLLCTTVFAVLSATEAFLFGAELAVSVALSLVNPARGSFHMPTLFF